MNDVLTARREKDFELQVSPELPEPLSRLVRGPRVVGELHGSHEGPTLIVVGGVHGNEPAGALALDRIFDELQAAELTDVRGRMVGLLGNRRALARNRRFLQHDLNRFWDPERVARLRERSGPLEAEAEELRELDREIERILGQGDGRPVYLLDLHTTSGEGPAFANLDDTLPNRRFALEFQVPLVVGIEEELAGTLTNYLFERGVTTLGFEAGQHQDAESPAFAAAAIWIALEAAGILPRGSRGEVAAARRRLAKNRGSLPKVVEIRHRHVVRPGSRFQMRPGYRNFQTVAAAEIETVAYDAQGAIRIREKSLILMPLYQEQGEDGFFLVRAVRPTWLTLSAVLRRLHLERYLHLLPGVRKNPDVPDHFTVDRRWARYLALELFHLLGFRRRGEFGRYLLLGRRPNDR